MDDPDPEGEHDDTATLCLVADRLLEIDDLLSDGQPFLRHLIRMAYVAALEALDSEQNDSCRRKKLLSAKPAGVFSG